MNIHDLREAQLRFEQRKDEVLKVREPLYKIRNSFVKYFNLPRLKLMEVDDYVLGVDLPAKGFNFCYSLERELDGLGRIIGSTSFKLGSIMVELNPMNTMNIASPKSLEVTEMRHLKPCVNLSYNCL